MHPGCDSICIWQKTGLGFDLRDATNILLKQKPYCRTTFQHYKKLELMAFSKVFDDSKGKISFTSPLNYIARFIFLRLHVVFYSINGMIWIEIIVLSKKKISFFNLRIFAYLLNILFLSYEFLIHFHFDFKHKNSKIISISFLSAFFYSTIQTKNFFLFHYYPNKLLILIGQIKEQHNWNEPSKILGADMALAHPRSPSIFLLILQKTMA